MPVTLMKARARGDGGGPLLRLVLLALAVFLSGWAVTDANAAVTSSGSYGLTSWSVESNLIDRVVSATESNAQIGRDVIARIGYNGKAIGSVAAVEMASIGVADIAAVVARASGPAMIALMVGDLAVRGIQRCLESGTGWCKRGSTNPNSQDDGFNGFVWSVGNYTANSPIGACNAYLDGALKPQYGSDVEWGTMSYSAASGCRIDNMYKPTGAKGGWGGSPRQTATCVSGYIPSGSSCVPDPAVPVQNIPITYPDIAAAWNAQMAGNPNRIADYWKQMSPDEQASASQNAQPKPTQISGSDVVSDPNAQSGSTSQTKPDGSLETCTTNTAVRVQARSNDGATTRGSPLNFNTTTQTTKSCPSGTTTETGSQDSGNTDQKPGTGGGAKQEVKVCGLADTAPCKIDETGTPTYKEPSVAKDKMDDADNRLKTKLDNIGQARSDQFGIGDIVKPLEGACAPFAYAIPKGAGVESVDIDLCPTLDLTRTGATWVWVFVSAVACILLVRDAINGG